MIELKRLKEQKEKIEKKLQLREERIAKLESEASIGVTDGMNTSLDQAIGVKLDKLVI